MFQHGCIGPFAGEAREADTWHRLEETTSRKQTLGSDPTNFEL
jgi:hypothetical protein